MTPTHNFCDGYFRGPILQARFWLYFLWICFDIWNEYFTIPLKGRTYSTFSFYCMDLFLLIYISKVFHSFIYGKFGLNSQNLTHVKHKAKTSLILSEDNEVKTLSWVKRRAKLELSLHSVWCLKVPYTKHTRNIVICFQRSNLGDTLVGNFVFLTHFSVLVLFIYYKKAFFFVFWNLDLVSYIKFVLHLFILKLIINPCSRSGFISIELSQFLSPWKVKSFFYVWKVLFENLWP